MSQIVQSFNGEPDKFKEWVKSIEKYATLTRLGNVDIPRIVYQACIGPVGDFIRRYLNVKEEAGEDPSWVVLKENLTTRFAEINYQHQAFAVLRKTKQKPSGSVQLFAERLLSNAEDAYPQAGDRPVVEQQMINVLLDGLYHDYLKMKVLRENPRTFNEALQCVNRILGNILPWDKIMNQKKIINLIYKMKHQWRSTISDPNGVINVKDKAIWQDIVE